MRAMEESDMRHDKPQLMHWHDLVRNEGEITRLKHFCGVIFHESLGLDMKVVEHFIRAPAANESNDAGINVCREKGICTSCTETAYRNIRW